MSDVDFRHTDARRANQTLGDVPAEASIGELISQLAGDFGNLVSTQVELAKVELKEDVARAGRGAGMLTGAGATGFLALTLASLALAWLLDDVMPRPLAFALVALAWAIVAGVLYASGRNQLEAMKFAPESKDALKEDVQWAKQQRS